MVSSVETCQWCVSMYEEKKFFVIFAKRDDRYSRGGATMTTAVLANDTQYIIPAADMDFFQQLAKRMGWTIRPKTEIDQAINDFETGNVRTFETVDQMMDYLNE